MTEKWIKSSYSASNGGECIEWAPAHAARAGVVPVRDSKDPSGPTLAFEPAAWSAFVAGVKAGDFGA
ncbi:DUF397 domain-containing protein [Streptomyces buecherae]|uniref:DUF397 domain-containing protein n=1 Tax=Streptomyces buecherae TaxID=2763006 RepID=A0A7H8NCT7_9ACTN|nr:DUF397 domain-containing protein [Streptomyces buecherae]QKW52186.1 DUF397 domain-containing protein [Streptomyces buecherae]